MTFASPSPPYPFLIQRHLTLTTSSDLDDVFTGARRDAGDAHDHAVPKDPRGDVLIGKAMAGEGQERHHPLQAIPCSRRRAHDVAALHHVSGGKNFALCFVVVVFL